MLLMTQRTGFHDIKTAYAVAKELQENDPDWKYVVTDLNNGYGRIDVFDEDNILVISGFIK